MSYLPRRGAAVIDVEPLDAQTAEEADALLAQVPGALFYATSQYRSLLVELLACDDISVVARERGRVRGVLPVLARDGTAGRIVNSMPYFGSNGGPLAVGPDAGVALARAYRELAMAPATAAATLVPTPFVEQPLETIPWTHRDTRIAQFTPLGQAFGRLEPSARRNVRKAERAGVVVERDPSALASLWELHTANLSALGGIPKDKRFFELVGARLEHGRDYELWTATLGADLAAALLIFFFNGVVEYFTPAISHAHRSLQPLAAILAAALVDAERRGMRLWNWGATWETQQSLRRFKRKWGAQERRYTYRVQVNDDRLLSMPQARLRHEYAGFYVVPFSALQGQEVNDPSPAGP